MSRAMNVNIDQAEVIARCAKHNAAISAIEPLLSGGTRVVFVNTDGAAVMRAAFGSKVIDGVVSRTKWISGQ